MCTNMSFILVFYTHIEMRCVEIRDVFFCGGNNCFVLVDNFVCCTKTEMRNWIWPMGYKNDHSAPYFDSVARNNTYHNKSCLVNIYLPWYGNMTSGNMLCLVCKNSIALCKSWNIMHGQNFPKHLQLHKLQRNITLFMTSLMVDFVRYKKGRARSP